MEKDKKNHKMLRLQKYHHRAIELRYEGKTYKEIAEETSDVMKKNFKESRVRNWFSGRGVLESLYVDYSIKENDRRRKIVLEELKKVTILIPKKYQQLLERKNAADEDKLDMVTVSALKNLAELLGFKASESTPEDPLAKYWDKAEEELDYNDKDESKAPDTTE